MEKFKRIPGVTGYFASSSGRILSMYRDVPRFLTPVLVNGYERVTLKTSSFSHRSEYVHILVAKAFCKNPRRKRTVNHLDGVKTNNIPCNLEWATHAENNSHAQKSGLVKPLFGSSVPSAKLSEAQVIEIRRLWGSLSRSVLARTFNVSQGCIQAIVERKSWKHI